MIFIAFAIAAASICLRAALAFTASVIVLIAYLLLFYIIIFVGVWDKDYK